MKKMISVAVASLSLAAVLAACASTPTASPGYVGLDAAKETALAASQMTAADATFTTAQLEDRNGTAYYALDFTDGATNYHYAVDAVTGAVIETSSEAVAGADAAAVSGPVDEAGAQAIALADAGVAEADTAYLRVQLDYDDGVQVYDVEFYVAATATEYDYEIDAATGAIRSKDFDAEGYVPGTGTTTGAAVDEAGAKSVALTDAGVAEADTAYLRVQLDYDDGRQVYDVEFYVASTATEYDYEIDASTGAILSKDFDAEGYVPTAGAAGGTTTGTTTGTTAGGAVDEAGAKSVALTDAGVAEADTAYLRVKLDYDDGRQVYDVEFYVASTATEYDYEIDASTGAILSKDFDAEGYAPAQTGSAMSEADIRAIALAMVPGATDSDVRMRQEYDDGRMMYEGSIYYDGMEYEFEIDAYSGAVLSWDAEPIFD